MSAELVDPFAPTRRYQGISEADVDTMIGNINADVARSQYDDPPLQAQLLAKTLTELRTATQGTDALAIWAADLLKAMWHRSQSGVPFDEPCEPAWSLDPDPRVMPTKDRS